MARGSGNPMGYSSPGRASAVMEDVGQRDGQAGQQRGGEGVGSGQGRTFYVLAVLQLQR